MHKVHKYKMLFNSICFLVIAENLVGFGLKLNHVKYGTSLTGVGWIQFQSLSASVKRTAHAYVYSQRLTLLDCFGRVRTDTVPLVVNYSVDHIFPSILQSFMQERYVILVQDELCPPIQHEPDCSHVSPSCSEVERSVLVEVHNRGQSVTFIIEQWRVCCPALLQLLVWAQKN